MQFHQMVVQIDSIVFGDIKTPRKFHGITPSETILPHCTVLPQAHEWVAIANLYPLSITLRDSQTVQDSAKVIIKHEYEAVLHALPISKFVVINWSFTAVCIPYTYVNQIGYCYSILRIILQHWILLTFTVSTVYLFQNIVTVTAVCLTVTVIKIDWVDWVESFLMPFVTRNPVHSHDTF